MSKINYDLIQQVKYDIMLEPEHFYMSDWVREISEENNPEPLVLDCGTAFCVAGRTNQRSGDPFRRFDDTVAACKDLFGHSIYFIGLFNTLFWREDLSDLYLRGVIEGNRTLKVEAFLQQLALTVDLIIEFEHEKTF